VQGNKPPEGGYLAFEKSGHEVSTIATWLQEAGYQTALYGKYLNGYHPERDGIPPGWSEWYGANGGYQNWDYTLNENGELVAYGHQPSDYLTDVLAAKAADTIRRSTAENKPFFLYVSPFSPHVPANPAPRHASLFAHEPLPRGPAFNEADVGDKPEVIRNLARLNEGQIASLETLWRRRLQCLQSIDDMVETIVDALDQAGVLDDTYIVYSSDNGHHLGEHRMPAGKDTAYEEDIRVPMSVRGPGVTKGARIDAMVANQDLAPTAAAMAGITPPAFVDGRSFLPLFEKPKQPWRRSFLLQRVGLEADELMSVDSFFGIRTHDHTYVEYGGGERELYDLNADPYQLDNIVETADPALVTALSTHVEALSTCEADRCRKLEDQDLP
jgi:arylsulfatase A-like enzyme